MAIINVAFNCVSLCYPLGTTFKMLKAVLKKSREGGKGNKKESGMSINKIFYNVDELCIISSAIYSVAAVMPSLQGRGWPILLTLSVGRSACHRSSALTRVFTCRAFILCKSRRFEPGGSWKCVSSALILELLPGRRADESSLLTFLIIEILRAGCMYCPVSFNMVQGQRFRTMNYKNLF